MELILQRRPSENGATIGDLYVLKGAVQLHECYTLEDVIREVPGEPVEKWKIPGVTAIPSGRYRVILSQSPRFTAMEGHPVWTPELLNVPGYVGIRIHPGNYPKDTEGCILTGTAPDPHGGAVWASRAAFDKLYLMLSQTINLGSEVWITVKNPEVST